MATTSTAPAAGASGAQAGAAPTPSAPFRAGTFRQLQTDGFSQTVTLGATAQQLNPYSPSPNSYIRGVWVVVTGTTSGNSASAAFNPDGPFCVIQSLTFQDANQKPIV